jgi:hypothetical protein
LQRGNIFQRLARTVSHESIGKENSQWIFVDERGVKEELPCFQDGSQRHDSRLELESTGIKVNVVSPSPTKTNLNNYD